MLDYRRTVCLCVGGLFLPNAEPLITHTHTVTARRYYNMCVCVRSLAIVRWFARAREMVFLFSINCTESSYTHIKRRRQEQWPPLPPLRRRRPLRRKCCHNPAHANTNFRATLAPNERTNANGRVPPAQCESIRPHKLYS